MRKIVLLDEQQLFMESFRRVLNDAGLDVVGTATSARAAYELVEKLGAELLVSELLLPDSDAAAVARELKRRELPAGLVVLTAQTNVAFVTEVMEAGARGYLLKTQPLSEVLQALHAAARGGQHVAPFLGIDAEEARKPARTAVSADGVLARLSKREREVFCQIIQGAVTSRQIARSLCISLKTVETHRGRINRKLAVHSPAELIRVAALAGLLRESAPGRSGPGPTHALAG